ncbi:MAG: hypothetical protein A4E62_00324 [Syntrophorhabdus sp. PtaU1.Bin002]|nr:MAG: hypothetical protein A4E62_00324 [Syntrophorhabdus sp. PtaU1.Bin002]
MCTWAVDGHNNRSSGSWRRPGKRSISRQIASERGGKRVTAWRRMRKNLLRGKFVYVI